eukprot:3623809-Alexandrium_andersonii.AAC.1
MLCSRAARPPTAPRALGPTSTSSTEGVRSRPAPRSSHQAASTRASSTGLRPLAAACCRLLLLSVLLPLL